MAVMALRNWQLPVVFGSSGGLPGSAAAAVKAQEAVSPVWLALPAHSTFIVWVPGVVAVTVYDALPQSAGSASCDVVADPAYMPSR